MVARSYKILLICSLIIGVMGCASMRPKIPVEKGSVEPGASVSRGEAAFGCSVPLSPSANHYPP